MKNKAHNTLAAIASAWNDSPRSIISLRDMIEFSASKLVNGLHLLEQHESKAEKLSHQNGGGSRPNEDQSGDLIENCLNPLLGFCEAVGLEKTSDRISELIIQLSGGLGRCGTCSQDMILSGIFAVRMILHEELGRRKFVALALGNDKYFEQAALFGKAVNRAFPSAVEDIRDAGGCLALGLNTAAVFHLMRAVEVAMRALARHVKVKIKKGDLEFCEWQRVISAIDDCVEKKLNPKQTHGSPPLPKKNAKKKSDDREFYRGIVASLHGFKDVWRNPVMHSRNRAKITEPDAMSVYSHVGDFMKRLAERISEQ